MIYDLFFFFILILILILFFIVIAIPLPLTAGTLRWSPPAGKPSIRGRSVAFRGWSWRLL